MDKEGPSAANRLAAETFMPMMVEAFHDGLREAGSLSRWLLATIVAINGAAAISILPLKMMPAAKLGSASAFLIGILAANGAGCWSLFSFKRVTTGAGYNACLLAGRSQRRSTPRSPRGNDAKTLRTSDWLTWLASMRPDQRARVRPWVRAGGMGLDRAELGTAALPTRTCCLPLSIAANRPRPSTTLIPPRRAAMTARCRTA